MLRVFFMLFAIVSCGAQLSSSVEGEKYNISAVALPTSTTKPSDARIIGGTPTTIQNYPFIVQILYNMQQICAGSLLTQRHVLSAGHCFVDKNGYIASPLHFSIRAGTTFLNVGGTVYYVSTIIVHENYNSPVRDNDVAVLLLDSAVTLGSGVWTTFIPLAGQVLTDNSTVVTIGWGRTSVNVQAASPVLNEVAIQTVNRETCAERYLFLENITNDPYPVTNNMICAGLLDVGGADACQGDSGGPLIYEGVVVGITSWGFSCAEPAFPGVYTKVSSFTTWINDTLVQYNGGPANSFRITTLLIPLVFLMIST